MPRLLDVLRAAAPVDPIAALVAIGGAWLVQWCRQRQLEMSRWEDDGGFIQKDEHEADT